MTPSPDSCCCRVGALGPLESDQCDYRFRLPLPRTLKHVSYRPHPPHLVSCTWGDLDWKLLSIIPACGPENLQGNSRGICSLFSGVGKGTAVTAEGKQQEEPGLRVLLPWEASHSIPLPSQYVSPPTASQPWVCRLCGSASPPPR